MNLIKLMKNCLIINYECDKNKEYLVCSPRMWR